MQNIIDLSLRIISELTECQCCERHNKNKPDSIPLNRQDLENWEQRQIANRVRCNHNEGLLPNGEYCNCTCRQEIRQICRMLATINWRDAYRLHRNEPTLDLPPQPTLETEISGESKSQN